MPCEMYGCQRMAKYGIGVKNFPHTHYNLCEKHFMQLMEETNKRFGSIVLDTEVAELPFTENEVTEGTEGNTQDISIALDILNALKGNLTLTKNDLLEIAEKNDIEVAEDDNKSILYDKITNCILGE